MITKKYLLLSAIVFLIIGFFIGQYLGVIPVFASDHDHDGLIDSVDTDDDNDGILDVEDAYPFDFDNDGIEDEKDNENKTAPLEDKNENLAEKVVDNTKQEKDQEKDNNDENSNEGDDTSPVSSITVSGTGSAVTWTVDGYSKNGFKIVWSKNSQPTYPTREGDKYIYLSEPASRSTTLDAFSGSGTYYVRVCEYLGGVCGVYSNQIEVSLGGGGDDTSPVSSITVSGTGSAVTWTVDGYSKNGFKIVWSKNSQPTYPTREGDKYIYLSEPASRSTTLDAFSGSGTYYVRVCEYLGGVCGVYSNQIEVNL